MEPLHRDIRKGYTMSTRLRITKDYNGYKKGDIVELRSAEAKQLLKASVASVQTDIGTETLVTKDSSNGNSTVIRPHNRRRR